MLKKVFGKAAAGTLAASLVLVPGAVVAGPQLSNVAYACDYPGGYATQTHLRMGKTVGVYGHRNRAHVRVQSGTGTPQGKVGITVGNRKTVVVTLDNSGRASYRLPRRLSAQTTYDVSARYRGKCDHNPSGDTSNYTVQKAGLAVAAAVAHPKRAKFNARLAGAGGLNPNVGSVRFKVKKNGKKVMARRVGVGNGYAEVDMANLKVRGKYRLITIYRGTANFERGVDRLTFRVKNGRRA